MNILQIVPEMNVGGVERGTYDLAITLVKKGHKSVVVSNGGELAEKLWGSGVIHYKLPVHEKNLITMSRMAKEVTKIIREEKIDLVHARSRVPAWIGFWASRKAGVPLITTCHGYYSTGFFSHVMGWGKFVIAISHAMARHMVENFNVPHARIRLIPRGVDLTEFCYRGETAAQPGKEEKEMIIGIVGRLTPLKGHADFLRAIPRVSQQYRNLRVWVIGDAPKEKQSYLTELQTLVRHLGIKDSVEFLGHRSDVTEVLRQLDLLVLATVTPEAFGRVLIEAQAVGVPVVATRVGGVVDVIEDEKTGLLVPPSDSVTMAAVILRVLQDPVLAGQLSRAARQRVEQEFSLEKMVEKTLAVYQEALEHKRILIIKTSSVGDVILATPSIRAVRQAYPKAWIAVLTGSESVPVLQRSSYVDEITAYDAKRRHRGWIGSIRLGNELRRYQFDLVIDLQNNKTSHLAGFLSFAPRRYGYRNGKWDFLLSHRCKDWKKQIPAVQHQFQLLHFAGIKTKEEFLELWISEADQEKTQKWLENAWVSANHKLVAISAFTSHRWVSKRWNTGRVAELMDRLGREGIRSVLVGAPGEESLARDLMEKTQSNPINLVGKTSMVELGALLKRCALLVTHDSAPLHVASAVGTPFVALFGPTDPQRHLPPYKEGTVLYRRLSCQPCYKTRCPLIHHQCLESITVEEVYQEVKKYLRDPSTSSLDKFGTSLRASEELQKRKTNS
ncbi:MAG: lipopolysaccharide heptosyltransferase II [Candidatus Omnitrophica bacterium]|nr:lipopolysaccharide heptosyltransferase II [Candidatus Omnitrophota bacterium]